MKTKIRLLTETRAIVGGWLPGFEKLVQPSNHRIIDDLINDYRDLQTQHDRLVQKNPAMAARYDASLEFTRAKIRTKISLILIPYESPGVLPGS